MPRVLISGAGIAGTVLAYWLGKNDFDVVVVERSKANNESGQIIDVEGPAQEIVKRMDVMEKIRSKITHVAGIRFVDDSNREFAKFPAGQTGISNEIEIMRPALAGVLLDAADSFPMSNFAIAVRFRAYSRRTQRSSSISKTKGRLPSSRRNLISSSLAMVCVQQLVTLSCLYPGASLA